MAGALVIAAAAACGGGVPAPEALSVTAAIRLPLQEFRLTDAERALANAARAALVRSCMRVAGFPRHAPMIIDAAGSELTSAATQRRYGVLDQATAQRWGYHLPQSPEAAARHAAAARWKRALPKPELRALDGAGGKTGCDAAASRRLREGVTAGDGRLLTKLDFHSLDTSRADPRLKRALAEWSACMATRGFHYGDPTAAASGGWPLAQPEPSLAEVATAVADVDCKARTALVDVWVTVETELQHALIAQRPRELAQVARAKRDYLANARRYTR